MMIARARQMFEPPMPGLFHGVYLAEVASLDDPDKLARVQVRVFNFDGVAGHDGPVWARVASPFAGNNRGAFLIPDVGDEVLISFVNGDSRFPIVIGGLWNGSDTAPASISGGQNLFKVIRSKNGVKLTLDDSDGEEQCILETPGGQKVTLKDGPGKITVEDSNGNSITMESAGITITASAKVTINASQVAVSAGMVQVDAGMSKFSGVVQCDTLIATTVVATTYTPGAGNIW
jgi:uncharacterized protein involved in type VI secretion and phage assembly